MIKLDWLYGHKAGKATNLINILVKDPHPNSLAGYIKLKQRYCRQDKERKTKKYQWKRWLSFRADLLRKIKRKEGALTCVYCGTKDLVINPSKGTPKKKQATLDHVIPLAKGGDRFNKDNLVVSCSVCNTEKGELSLDEFLKKPKVA